MEQRNSMILETTLVDGNQQIELYDSLTAIGNKKVLISNVLLMVVNWIKSLHFYKVLMKS